MTEPSAAEQQTATSFSWPQAIRHWGCGLAMGIADAVPGVSGGTIALILGIYDRLIGSIADVLGILRRPTDRQAWTRLFRALLFLVPLAIGAVMALVTALKLLVGKKPDYSLQGDALWQEMQNSEALLINPNTAPIVFGLFFGLVLSSLNEPWKQRRAKHTAHYALMLVGAGLSAGMAVMPVMAATLSTPVIMLAGAIAISVMLLPGISGSLALLLLGLYQPIAQAATSKDIPRLIAFFGGIIIGLIIFIPLLRLLLRKGHDAVMAFLTGLMAGSLVALWPWKPHYLPKAIAELGPMHPIMPSGSWWWVCLSMLIGAAIVPIMGRIAASRQTES